LRIVAVQIRKLVRLVIDQDENRVLRDEGATRGRCEMSWRVFLPKLVPWIAEASIVTTSGSNVAIPLSGAVASPDDMLCLTKGNAEWKLRIYERSSKSRMRVA
jgi:hypothetical protein